MQKQRLHIVRPHIDAITELKARSRKGPRIATGFTPSPELDLKFFGGRTLQDLAFKNYYLGNWPAGDAANIDRALAGALTDPGLNRVLQQYFDNKPVTATFLGSVSQPAPTLTPGAVFDRDAVHATLAALDLGNIDRSKTIVCLYLPPGVILDTKAMGGVGDQGRRSVGRDDKDSSLEGLGGYHGSAHIGGQTVYFAVCVYSQATPDGINGIPFWPDSWKNVVATMYHELTEARTDPDVEEVNRTSNQNLLGWYSDAQGAGEIGDIPMNEAGSHLGRIFVEVALQAGGSAPIQLMWSNTVHGPCGPY